MVIATSRERFFTPSTIERPRRMHSAPWTACRARREKKCQSCTGRAARSSQEELHKWSEKVTSRLLAVSSFEAGPHKRHKDPPEKEKNMLTSNQYQLLKTWVVRSIGLQDQGPHPGACCTGGRHHWAVLLPRRVSPGRSQGLTALVGCLLSITGTRGTSYQHHGVFLSGCVIHMPE